MAVPPNANQPDPHSADPLADNPVDQLEQGLLSRLQDQNALPFLFVGSGMSRRYLDLPDWHGMLRHFAEDIHVDFDHLLATADGDLPRAATLLALEFHNPWFTDPKYEDQRSKYKNLVRDQETALKVAIAEYISANSELTSGTPGVDNTQLAAELSLLSSAVVDGVITTNYDGLVDQVFDDFASYVGQDELLLSDAQFVAETYKIHGDHNDPPSLVLTERDYTSFESRNKYLASKLLTIFAEHPVVFLGYGLNDPYIRDIINEIAQAVGPSRLDELAERIYFVEWSPDPHAKPEIARFYLDVASGRPLPATRVTTHSMLPVFGALASLSRPFPAKVLRELRHHVYDLVTHPDGHSPSQSVRAVPFDSREADGLKVVFGVGEFPGDEEARISQVGFQAINREVLVRDALEINTTPLSASQVLEISIPDILKTPTKHLPIWKFLSEIDVSSTEELKNGSIPDKVKQAAVYKIEPNRQAAARFNKNDKGLIKTPRQLFNTDQPRYHKLDALLCLDPDDYELDELRDVIRDQYDTLHDLTPGERSSFYKSVAHYDRLKWGPSPQ